MREFEFSNHDLVLIDECEALTPECECMNEEE